MWARSQQGKHVGDAVAHGMRQASTGSLGLCPTARNSHRHLAGLKSTNRETGLLCWDLRSLLLKEDYKNLPSASALLACISDFAG